ncbi:centrosome and spindle pole-associated protein 1 isoform X2 [Chanodichthys erythropterus]|uniref:centrosome and spindle pole-associated protein 1 isoform X2 n=2 Tax=Chanodichthys erythropterus TaxID=933992 RepID=UPI00351DCEDE
MNVNISNFMEERRAETEEAPYMEMKTSFGNKENIKPANKTQPSQPKQTKEETFGLSLPLGEEYERKKQKLKQELRLDYRRFVSEKKNQMIADPLPQSHMLSLPIKERRSAKEKLHDERNKEYNLFLRGQGGSQKIGKSSSTPQALDRFGSITPKYPAGSPEVQVQRGSQGPENITFSRRDVATLTEPISGVPKVSRPRRHWAETPDRWGGPYRDHTSSDEEIELPEKERLRNVQEDTGAIRRGGKHDNSSHSLQAPTRAQNRSVNEQNMTEFATGLMIGAAEGDEASQRRKERYRLELLQQIAEQQKNKRKEKELELRVAATGAVDPEKKPDRIKQFGAVTREYEGRRRDVPYHPGLGLEVFRADSARRLKEDKPPQAPKESAPPERPRVAFQSPSLDHSTVLSRLANTSGLGLEAGANGTTPVTENNYRSLSRALGEIVAPRITGVRPPLGPSLTDSYQTPYDNAYYYYGARNPLDPNLAHYGPAGDQQSHIPPEAHWPVLQPPSGRLPQAISHAEVVPSGPAFFSHKRLQQPKESAVSHQEALKQQIQERQQRRHREKVETELYDAKLEAEMKAYEPWGRGGGGAPLRDNHGNLISDLKQMHKSNVEAYDSGGRVARIPVASRTEPAGFAPSQPPVQARGNLFNELPSPQQLHDQEKYKDCLKQQIEEKRRKEAEERERSRLEDEKEERRLAEQRARIQREFEEEQERKRQKEKEQIAKNEELIRQAEERRKEAEKLRKEVEEKENEALRKIHEREKQTHLEEVHRAPSPPLPTLQKKLRQQMPRPPSEESHRSSTTVSMRSMSAPHSPPVPARRNEIRATEEKQTVIRELSALRRQLRSEQRRLEGQLMQSNGNDHTPPIHGRPREHLPEEVFEVARLHKQVPIRRPASHTTAGANMHNLQEFNHLKYRDGASRTEVRRAYPDPPSDDHSLDIQQQALLRQQQRTINSLRGSRPADYFDMVSSGKQHLEQRLNSAENPGRRLLLDSESAFIDPSGDSFHIHSRRDQRARPAVRKTDISDDVLNRYTRPDSGPDSQSLNSLTSTEIERLRERTKNKMTSLNYMREHDWRSGEVSAEEGEELWSQTPSTNRRVSIDTIATDPWLRPSSSDTLKRFMGGRRPSNRNHAAGQDWEGPSTYHG